MQSEESKGEGSYSYTEIPEERVERRTTFRVTRETLTDPRIEMNITGNSIQITNTGLRSSSKLFTQGDISQLIYCKAELLQKLNQY